MWRWVVPLFVFLCVLAAPPAAASAQGPPHDCSYPGVVVRGAGVTVEVPPDECAVPRLPGPEVAPAEAPATDQVVYEVWDVRPMSTPIYRFAPGGPDGWLYCLLPPFCGPQGEGWRRGGDLGRLVARYGELARAGLLAESPQWEGVALASLRRWGGWLEVTDAFGTPLARWQGEEGQRLAEAVASAQRVVAGVRGPAVQGLADSYLQRQWGSAAAWPWPARYLRLHYGDLDATVLPLAPAGLLAEGPLALVGALPWTRGESGVFADVLLEGLLLEGEVAQRLQAVLPSASRPPDWEAEAVPGTLREVTEAEPELRSVVVRRGGQERLVLLRQPIPRSAVFYPRSWSDPHQLRTPYLGSEEWEVELEWGPPRAPLGGGGPLPDPVPASGIYYPRARVLILLHQDAEGRLRGFRAFGDLLRVVEAAIREQREGRRAAPGVESGPVAAVVGGAVGGALALSLLYWLARRRQRARGPLGP